MTVRLTDFRVLSFDCYGTIIDWETGILRALSSLTLRLERDRTPDDILATFGRHEANLEAEMQEMLYGDLLAEVYRLLAHEWRLTFQDEDAIAFGESVGHWPPFADSAQALKRLKERYVLVILSNVDRASFTASQSLLGVEFDHVFTAEEIGSYKPSLANFDFMLRRLKEMGFERECVLHTAQSLFHDHLPANQLGLRSAWINRPRRWGGSGATPRPNAMPHLDFQFASLKDMADAVGGRLRQDRA